MFTYTPELLMVLISVYWSGDKLRQNPKIDACITMVEQGYASFNERLRTASLPDGLLFLRRFYGWVAAVSVTAMILSVTPAEPVRQLVICLFLITFIGALGWTSLTWCTEHKQMSVYMGMGAAMMSCSPFLLAILELRTGTTIIQASLHPMLDNAQLLGITFPPHAHPLIVAALMSLVFMGFSAAVYVTTWLIAVPAAFASVLLAAISIRLARIVHTLAPRNAFDGLTLLAFVAASLWVVLQ